MARHWLAAVTYGITAALLIILASAFLLASLLRFTSYSESTGSILPLIISLLSLFIGGVIAGSKMKERGLLIGAITGLIYCCFSFFFQFLGFDHAPGFSQYGFFAANIAAAALGGVVGVNLFSAKH